jgi:hypothetical protein
MPHRRLFLPVLLLSFTALCAAKEKTTVCVSVSSEQDTLKSSLASFEKAAVKQVTSGKRFVGASAGTRDQCDYTLSLTVTEERPYEAGVVMRTANDPLLREQAERPYIRFNVSYVLKRNAPADVLKEGSGFRREDSYPDPSARLSAIEDAVDNSMKVIKSNP